MAGLSSLFDFFRKQFGTPEQDTAPASPQQQPIRPLTPNYQVPKVDNPNITTKGGFGTRPSQPRPEPMRPVPPPVTPPVAPPISQQWYEHQKAKAQRPVFNPPAPVPQPQFPHPQFPDKDPQAVTQPVKALQDLTNLYQQRQLQALEGDTDRFEKTVRANAPALLTGLFDWDVGQYGRQSPLTLAEQEFAQKYGLPKAFNLRALDADRTWGFMSEEARGIVMENQMAMQRVAESRRNMEAEAQMIENPLLRGLYLSVGRGTNWLWKQGQRGLNLVNWADLPQRALMSSEAPAWLEGSIEKVTGQEVGDNWKTGQALNVYLGNLNRIWGFGRDYVDYQRDDKGEIVRGEDGRPVGGKVISSSELWTLLLNNSHKATSIIGSAVAEDIRRFNMLNDEIDALEERNPELADTLRSYSLPYVGNVERQEKWLEDTVAKYNVEEIEAEAERWHARAEASASEDERIRAGQMAVSLQQRAQLLRNKSYFDISNENTQASAQLVAGILLDPTNLADFGLTKGVKALRAARALSATADVADLSRIQKAVTAGEEAVAALTAGQKVDLPRAIRSAYGGPLAGSNIPLLSKTPDAKAAIDANIVTQALYRITRGVDNKEDFAALLNSWANTPEELIQGVGGLTSPQLLRGADDTGKVYFGNMGALNEEALLRHHVLQLAMPDLLSMKSLNAATFNPQHVWAEATDIIDTAARKFHGVSVLDSLPYGAVTINVSGDSLEFLGKKGELLRTQVFASPAEAVAGRKAILDALNQSNPLRGFMKLARMPDRLQRNFMTRIWLNLSVRTMVRNALGAAGATTAEGVTSFGRMSDIANRLEEVAAVNPRLRAAIDDYRGAVAGYVNPQTGRQAGRSTSPNRFRRAVEDIWNGVHWTQNTNIGGRIPVGEQSWYTRAVYAGFTKVFDSVWDRFLRGQMSITPSGTGNVLSRLTRMGMNPEQAEALVSLMYDAGRRGSREDVMEAARAFLVPTGGGAAAVVPPAAAAPPPGAPPVLPPSGGTPPAASAAASVSPAPTTVVPPSAVPPAAAAPSVPPSVVPPAAAAPSGPPSSVPVSMWRGGPSRHPKLVRGQFNSPSELGIEPTDLDAEGWKEVAGALRDLNAGKMGEDEANNYIKTILALQAERHAYLLNQVPAPMGPRVWMRDEMMMEGGALADTIGFLMRKVHQDPKVRKQQADLLIQGINDAQDNAIFNVMESLRVAGTPEAARHAVDAWANFYEAKDHLMRGIDRMMQEVGPNNSPYEYSRVLDGVVKEYNKYATHIRGISEDAGRAMVGGPSVPQTWWDLVELQMYHAHGEAYPGPFKEMVEGSTFDLLRSVAMNPFPESVDILWEAWKKNERMTAQAYGWLKRMKAGDVAKEQVMAELSHAIWENNIGSARAAFILGSEARAKSQIEVVENLPLWRKEAERLFGAGGPPRDRGNFAYQPQRRRPMFPEDVPAVRVENPAPEIGDVWGPKSAFALQSLKEMGNIPADEKGLAWRIFDAFTSTLARVTKTQKDEWYDRLIFSDYHPNFIGSGIPLKGTRGENVLMKESTGGATRSVGAWFAQMFKPDEQGRMVNQTALRNALDFLGKEMPENVREAASFFQRQRNRIGIPPEQGGMRARDYAKAHVYAVASQNARHVPLDTFKAGFGNALERLTTDPEYIKDTGYGVEAFMGISPILPNGKGGNFITKFGDGPDLKDFVQPDGNIRPEDAAAWWFTTPSGQAALQGIDNNQFLWEYWRELEAIRTTFNGNRFRATGVVPGARNQFNQRWWLGDPELYHLMTQMGSAEALETSVTQGRWAGLGEVKGKFFQSLLGVGNAPTLDARQIQFWTGLGQLKEWGDDVPPEVVDMVQRAAQTQGALTRASEGAKSSKASRTAMAAMYDSMGVLLETLKARGVWPEGISDDVAQATLHHWLWSRIGDELEMGQGRFDTVQNVLGPLFKKDIAFDRTRSFLGLHELHNDGTRWTTVFSGGDTRVLLHEMGHDFITMLDVAATISEEARTQMDIIEKWVGKKYAFWNSVDHEKFTETLELYYREGLSPVPELVTVFDRIREMVRLIFESIYGHWDRNVQNWVIPNADLTDEIRGVIDWAHGKVPGEADDFVPNAHSLLGVDEGVPFEHIDVTDDILQSRKPRDLTPADIDADRVDRLHNAMMGRISAKRAAPMTSAAVPMPVARDVLNYLSQEVLPQFDNLVYGAFREGERLGNMTMLNGADTRGFDGLMSTVMPYSFFWSRSARNWAQRSIMHPAWSNFYAETADAAERNTQEQGLQDTANEGRIPVWTDAQGNVTYIQNPTDFIFPWALLQNDYVRNEGREVTGSEKMMNQYLRSSPGLFPSYMLAWNEYLDQTAPLPDGKKRAEWDIEAYIPQASVVGDISMATTGTQFFGRNPTYPIPFGAQQGAPAGVFGDPEQFERQTQRAAAQAGVMAEGDTDIQAFAQQIAYNIRNGQERGYGIPEEFRPAAELAYQRASQDAGWELFLRGVSFWTGLAASTDYVADRKISDVRKQDKALGYNAETSPYGGRELKEEFRAQNPAIKLAWNIGGDSEAGAPGLRAQYDALNQLIGMGYDGMKAEMEKAFATAQAEAQRAGERLTPDDAKRIEDEVWDRFNSIIQPMQEERDALKAEMEKEYGRMQEYTQTVPPTGTGMEEPPVAGEGLQQGPFLRDMNPREAGESIKEFAFRQAKDLPGRPNWERDVAAFRPKDGAPDAEWDAYAARIRNYEVAQDEYRSAQLVAIGELMNAQYAGAPQGIPQFKGNLGEEFQAYLDRFQAEAEKGIYAFNDEYYAWKEKTIDPLWDARPKGYGQRVQALYDANPEYKAYAIQLLREDGKDIPWYLGGEGSGDGTRTGGTGGGGGRSGQYSGSGGRSGAGGVGFDWDSYRARKGKAADWMRANPDQAMLYVQWAKGKGYDYQWVLNAINGKSGGKASGKSRTYRYGNSDGEPGLLDDVVAGNVGANSSEFAQRLAKAYEDGWPEDVLAAFLDYSSWDSDTKRAYREAHPELEAFWDYWYDNVPMEEVLKRLEGGAYSAGRTSGGGGGGRRRTSGGGGGGGGGGSDERGGGGPGPSRGMPPIQIPLQRYERPRTAIDFERGDRMPAWRPLQTGMEEDWYYAGRQLGPDQVERNLKP